MIDDLATMDEEGIPDELWRFQLSVPKGLDHEQKLAWVDRKAAAWGVRAVSNAMGRHAEKRYGDGLCLIASVADQDRSVSGYKARAAALAANGMGATA